ELTPEGHRLFKVNGRPILIRGGGWASDMMLRPASAARLEAEMRYVREMGLNTIRLEGKLESDLFYERADRLGILVMPGWCCCDQWEKWDEWTAENHRVACASLEVEGRLAWSRPVLSSATEAKSTLTGASGVKMRGPYDYVPPRYWLTDEK